MGKLWEFLGIFRLLHCSVYLHIEFIFDVGLAVFELLFVDNI